MKIRNWRRRLAAVLMAGGILVPAAAVAAPLGVNLVVNGDFENVDLAATGDYGGPRILGWTGPNLFAYSHNGSASSAGVVPDPADGADPPGAGNWYFGAGNTGTNSPDRISERHLFYQDIDVSTGATADAIASDAGATFTAAAWMSSSRGAGDIAIVWIDFIRSNGDFIIGHEFADRDFLAVNDWSFEALDSRPVTLGTAKIRVSLYGVNPINPPVGDSKAYVDIVELIIRANVPEPSGASMALIGVFGAGRRRGRD
jgi:hypothetical protein